MIFFFSFQKRKMEALVSSFKDLLKYKIVASINTGDKTFDNLLNTILLTIMSLCFTVTFWKKTIIDFYYRSIFYLQRKKITELTKQNFHMHVVEINNNPPEFMQPIEISKNPKISSYIIKNFAKCLSLESTIFDFKENAVSTKSFEKIVNNLPDAFQKFKQIIPIYFKNGQYVGVSYENNRCINLIHYSSIEIIKEFSTLINEIDVKEPEQETEEVELITPLKILFNGENSGKYIYTDRNFDSIVSRYKQDILNALDEFKLMTDRYTQLVKINKVVALNPDKYRAEPLELGMFNLGFILYGLPGTGKTSVIKAICNYLRRDCDIIDMRLIKTKEQFEELFFKSDYTKKVIVFDEFDSVQGVISREDTKTEDCYRRSNNEEKKELKDRYYSLITNCSEQKDPVLKKSMDEEIKKIQKRVSELENVLTIDTILQVLDGLIEMRGRVIIATTNYINRIDSALLREGRFDFKIELGHFNDEEAKELLKKIFVKKASKEDFAYMKTKTVRENEFTPVQIVHLAYKYRNLRKVIDHIAVPSLPAKTL